MCIRDRHLPVHDTVLCCAVNSVFAHNLMWLLLLLWHCRLVSVRRALQLLTEMTLCVMLVCLDTLVTSVTGKYRALSCIFQPMKINCHRISSFWQFARVFINVYTFLFWFFSLFIWSQPLLLCCHHHLSSVTLACEAVVCYEVVC